jgi:ATP synthase protein I
MAQLEAKIAAAKKATEPKPRGDEHYSQANLAWRMVIELVAGLMIGFGIGFGLDSLFGTMPLFLVIFILLGLAAGIRVMLRTAQEAQKTPPGDLPGNE